MNNYTNNTTGVRQVASQAPTLLERLWNLLRERGHAIGAAFHVSHRELGKALGCSPGALPPLMRSLEALKAINRTPISTSFLITVLAADRSISEVENGVENNTVADRSISDSSAHQDTPNPPRSSDQQNEPKKVACMDHVFIHDHHQQHDARAQKKSGCGGRPPEVFPGAWRNIQTARPGYTAADWFRDLAAFATRRDVPPAARVPALVNILSDPDSTLYSQADIDARTAETPQEASDGHGQLPADRPVRPGHTEKYSNRQRGKQRGRVVPQNHLPADFGMEFLYE